MSAEDKCEFLKSENEQRRKENCNLKSHIEGLEDAFHEVMFKLEGELTKTTNDLNSQIRENLGFINRIACLHKKLKDEQEKVSMLYYRIEELESNLTQSKMK